MAKSVKVQVIDSDFAVLLRESVTYEIKMEPNSKGKIRTLVLCCVALAIFGIIYLGYFCPEQVCALSSYHSHFEAQTLKDRTAILPIHDNLGRPLSFLSNPSRSALSNPGAGLSYDDVFNGNFQREFDMNGHDVMVFLHMQKTGGTSFGKHLVKDLDLQRPCDCRRRRKRCYCFRPNRNENWLFSRYSTGWKCGLHADWTELTSCVDTELDKNEGDKVKRRYLSTHKILIKIHRSRYSEITVGTYVIPSSRYLHCW